MSDVREMARSEPPPNLWRPISDFERDMSRSLRLLDGARRGYQLERGSLTETQQARYLAVQMMLKRDVETVIGIKEIERLTRVDELPGIGLFHDGVHVFVTAPSAQDYHYPREVIMPIEELDEEAQKALPPLSEEAVVKGLEGAEERVRIAWRAVRHPEDDPSFPFIDEEELGKKYQEAVKEKAERILSIVRYKSELPNIKLSLAADNETVTITLPSTATRTEPLLVVTTLKALESIEPKIRGLLPPQK